MSLYQISQTFPMEGFLWICSRNTETRNTDKHELLNLHLDNY